MMQYQQSLEQSEGHLGFNYAELGLESLKFRQWFWKLACFYKIQSMGLPSDTFKNSFFPHKWNKLDEKIKGAR